MTEATSNALPAGRGKSATSQIAESAAVAGRQLWLAGLGVLALVGKAAKAGGQAFDRLVEQGKEVEPAVTRRYQKVREEVGGAIGGLENKVREVGAKVRSAAGPAESELDQKVLAALERLGIPTREDIRALTDRVEALLNRLQAEGGGSAQPGKHSGSPADA